MLAPDQYTPGSISAILRANHKDDSKSTKLSRLFLKPSKEQDQVIPQNKEEVKLLSVKPKDKEINDLTFKKGSKVTSKSLLPDEDNNSLNEPKVTRSKKCQSELNQKENSEKIEDKNKRSVFVGCLPVNLKKKRLKKLFQKYGEIESIRLRSIAPEDPKLPRKAVAATGKFHPNIHTLNAYIVFKNKSAAEKATELNNTEVDGSHIRVDFLGSKHNQHDHKRSIFIGNLPFDAHEEELREHFSECGEIESVRLIRDKLTRFGKGFGYILFADKGSVLLSLKLDGQRFKGRCLRVQRSTTNAQPSEKPVKKSHSKQVERVKTSAEHRKRKHSEATHTGERSKKKKVVVKINQTGKLTVMKKDKLKKKFKRRIERKKKQNLAEILLGNKH